MFNRFYTLGFVVVGFVCILKQKQKYVFNFLIIVFKWMGLI